MRWLSLPLCTLALLAAACGDGFSLQFGGLQVDALQEQILTDLEQELTVDLESVECESGVQPREGDVFRCFVYAVDDDSVGIVQVTQVDDQGNVTWELTDVQAPSGEDSQQ